MNAHRLAAVAVALLACGCATSTSALLGRGGREAAEGEYRAARDDYDRAAARPDAGREERVQALVGAAQACDKLGDPLGARTRLERAVEPEVPGVTEAALFYLAEHVRGSDRARALNLYYRAAAGAEKRGGGFPYRAAMDRIVQLSQTE